MAKTVVKTRAFGAPFITLIFLLLLTTTFSSARKSGGGSGGRYGGHGGGSHSYGGIGSHSYGGGGHTYPSSTGYSGTGTGGVHTYPASTGLSGNSVNNHITKQSTTYQHNSQNHVAKTEVHHHYHQNYHYSPPPQVSYGSVTYPVYHAQPPVYVYQYRDSGSRFDTLLTGLALYNLGKMSANHDHYHYDSNRRYESAPGETCKLGIRKSNGDYEETRVNCEIMSSFIWETDMSATQQPKPHNTFSTTVVNVTQVHSGEPNSNNSVTTITVTNTTVVDALEAKGQSIKVTPDMTCYMIRITRISTMKKEVKCGVLEAYARSSWRNACEGISSTLSFVTLLIYEMFLYEVI